MRLLTLMLLFMAVSCGDYKVDGSGITLGESRTLNPSALNSGERNQFGRICQALVYKQSQLPQALNSNHKFSLHQTNCSNETQASEVVTTTIQGMSSQYIFRNVNGMDFVFPEVETATSGVLAQVCSQLAEGFSTPYVLPNGDARWITATAVDTTHCPVVGNEMCVQVETGSPQGGSFVIHTKEWIRFQVDPNLGKFGFFTYRKKVSRAFCPISQFIQTQVNLQ